MASVEVITNAVNRYLELVANGTADEIAGLYADDATVEDPVGGGEVHIGRQAIHGFYKNIENIPRATELHSLRVCGHEAAFMFSMKLLATLTDVYLLKLWLSVDERHYVLDP